MARFHCSTSEVKVTFAAEMSPSDQRDDRSRREKYAAATPMLATLRRRRRSLGLFLAALALMASNLGYAQETKDREFRECPDCPEMVGVPAGQFVMGSPRGEPGRFDSEGPQHVVSVTAFALGKYNVTSQQFLTFLKDTG